MNSFTFPPPGSVWNQTLLLDRVHVHGLSGVWLMCECALRPREHIEGYSLTLWYILRNLPLARTSYVTENSRFVISSWWKYEEVYQRKLPPVISEVQQGFIKTAAI